MARKKRQWSPYHYNHVVMRGNNRQIIFSNSADYQAFFRVLQYAHQKYTFSIVAYCIMSNHYHLLIRSPEVPLGKVMAIINRRYSEYFKQKYQYTGQLYERRYFAELVPSPIGMLTVSRYIHRNPISTNTPIVEKMEHYPYSSFQHYKYNIPSHHSFLDTTLLKTFLPQNSQAYCHYCEEEQNEQLMH
ncbi:transposase [Lysinibacillus parviboronicapiens]|uniref:transposase n=1 Tax=Lysinibacillus parviboronicapiens TaxID=436516 RepID=UPI000D3AA830|nr:transposase [Lysinibacillus parviboronicapiens]